MNQFVSDIQCGESSDDTEINVKHAKKQTSSKKRFKKKKTTKKKIYIKDKLQEKKKNPSTSNQKKTLNQNHKQISLDLVKKQIKSKNLLVDKKTRSKPNIQWSKVNLPNIIKTKLTKKSPKLKPSSTPEIVEKSNDSQIERASIVKKIIADLIDSVVK